MVYMDEAYKFFNMVGLINASSNNSKAGDAHTVPDAASKFNKLLQTGTASLTTETAGTFGAGKVPRVPLGISGNAHPSLLAPMLRGDFGNDVAVVPKGLLITSGSPIEPYQALPRRMSVPLGFKRWKWPRLLRCMFQPLGTLDDAKALDSAGRSLKKAQVRRPGYPQL